MRPTLRILAWAVALGALFGVSPHTSATRPLVKLAGGVAIGVAFLALASRRRAGAERSPTPGIAGRVPLLLWVALALGALLFLPTAAELYRHYTEDIWTNGHGLFVLPVAGALAAAILRRDASPAGPPSTWGYLPFCAGIALLVLDAGIGTAQLSVLGLLLLFTGLSLLVLGAARTRALAFPLGLLVFLAPLPSSLAMPFGLNDATASGAATLLRLLGTPVLRDGPVLVMPTTISGVSANCSGFSMLYAGVGAALVLGWASRSGWRLLALLLAVWPLVVVANTLRTTAIVLIRNAMGPAFHDTPLHGLSGIAAFWLVMLCLWLMSDRRALRESFA